MDDVATKIRGLKMGSIHKMTLCSKMDATIFFTFQGGKKNFHGLSPRANYTDRATPACRRSDCQLLRIEGATW
jgi:hypothetical protein